MSESVPSWFGFGLKTMQCWQGAAEIVVQLSVCQLVEEIPEWRVDFLCW